MPTDPNLFCTIDEAIDELRRGRMIVLVDDEHRENEGDVVVAAEYATPEAINFMMRNACGLVCLSLSQRICDRLHLEPMQGQNVDPLATPFTPPIDARTGITTGTSAFDRSRTVAVAIDDNSTPNDLIRGKGHVHGLRAHPGGVLVRAGHTEGSVDLARLAGLREGAVICEVVHPDGSMARSDYLAEFARTHGLKMCTIEDLIKYRRQREKLIRREEALKLPTRYGDFDLVAYTSLVDPEPHLALCLGGVGLATGGEVPVQQEPVLVRIHSQCLTGDVFGSCLCDCGPQLHQAMTQVRQAGKGVILYMRQEGRGIGLLPKLKAYKLQQSEGLDTVEANERLGYGPDLRHYGIGAQILHDLGVRDIKLLTNNPRKVVGLDGYGLRIVERVPIHVTPNALNQRYLRVKKEKLGHLLEMGDLISATADDRDGLAMTTEQLLALPHDNCRRWLIRGGLREAPREPGCSRSACTLAQLLGDWAASQPEPRGRVFCGTTHCRLSRDPDTTAAADAIYAPAERTATGQHGDGTLIEGPPTLVVSYLSPGDNQQQTNEIVDACLDAGVTLVWLVNAHDRTVTIYRPGAEPELLNRRQELTGGDVLPGFRVPVAKLFEG